MDNHLISARVELNDYTNKVLGIIKIKFGLRDKSEALNKFIEIYGDNVIEKEVNDKYLKKVIFISENHLKKYGKRKMSLQELNKLCED
jgi:hypothetical protein